MGYPVSYQNTTQSLDFLMILSSDHVTGATGKTVTVTLLKSGASSFTAPSGAVSELAQGWYRLAANATDANTLGPLLLHATATGCDPRDDTFSVVNYNPTNVAPFSPPTSATFGTTTGRDIVSGAFMLIGAFDPEAQSLTAQQAQDGLRRLNNMIATWSLQPGTMLSNTREVFPLVPNQATYTIGPGGDFDTVRPIYLQGIGLLLDSSPATSPVVELQLGLLTDDAYRSLITKGITQPLTLQAYYNRTAPLGTIILWQVPTVSNSLAIYSMRAIDGFADLTTPYALAPGYQEAMEYNLALRLATPWGRELPGDVRALAMSAMKWIKTANSRLTDLVLDPGLVHDARGIYNILTDRPS